MRRGRRVYYRKVREGRRVRSIYFGDGPEAEAAALEDEQRRACATPKRLEKVRTDRLEKTSIQAQEKVSTEPNEAGPGKEPTPEEIRAEAVAALRALFERRAAANSQENTRTETQENGPPRAGLLPGYRPGETAREHLERTERERQQRLESYEQRMRNYPRSW
jgi:hypothetical protein